MAAHTAGTVDIGVRRAVCDSAAGDTRMPVVVCVALPGTVIAVKAFVVSFLTFIRMCTFLPMFGIVKSPFPAVIMDDKGSGIHVLCALLCKMGDRRGVTKRLWFAVRGQIAFRDDKYFLCTKRGVRRKVRKDACIFMLCPETAAHCNSKEVDINCISIFIKHTVDGKAERARNRQLTAGTHMDASGR